MKPVMSLALILGLGCANYAMRAEHTATELDLLRGTSDPVRTACREQSQGARDRLPIQVRSESGPRAAEAAFVDCMDVLTVFVSVAMHNGDTTEDGLGAVRNRLTGLDSAALADACDDHYEAWQILWVAENPHRRMDTNTFSDDTQARYDFWMRRCRRVLRPVAAAGP